MFYIGLFLFPPLGCSSGPTRYETEWEQEKKIFISQMVEIQCPKREEMGKVLGSCDSISERFFRELSGIKKATCDNNGIKGQKCGHALTATLFARYQLRYPYADWKFASTWCQANPNQCDFRHWQGADMFEFELVRTHNRAIHELAMSTRDEIQARSDLGCA